MTENLKSVVADAFEITADRASTEQVDFPLMPLGTARDMGRDEAVVARDQLHRHSQPPQRIEHRRHVRLRRIEE